ncbi:MAG: 3-mercaptopyruvate sulfurtransferase, partial [Proteobacteria bacterium]|nr:3-mercaptopyruvate sulfurtransferase [Pseudomonadota bacterium]
MADMTAKDQGPLVTTAWLAEHLDDPDVVILDASWHMPATGRDPRKEYAEGHIPGSRFFDIDAISDHSSGLPHMLASPQEFATAVRRLGVEATSTVVVYDAVGIMSAPRAWWNFRQMGHDQVYVLDGGLKAWLAEGHPVETGWREPPHGEFKAHARPALVRDIDQVRAALGSGAEQVVDARPSARFTGEAAEPRAGLRGGHMPGARNVPFGALVTGDGTLAPPADIKAAFEAAGVDLARPIVTSCGS